MLERSQFTCIRASPSPPGHPGPVGDVRGRDDGPWPTRSWTLSSPDAEGLNGEPFDALDRAIRAGTHGNVDRMIVVRNGRIVRKERYEHDYRAISRGQRGALGCGFASCDDETEVHEYNYYHPDWHPYYQGRDVHSLQSVTKSVSSSQI